MGVPSVSPVPHVRLYLPCAQLAASGKKFTSLDYVCPTPDWAVFGHAAAGFDPKQTRVKKERKHPGKSNSSSCATSMAGDDVATDL